LRANADLTANLAAMLSAKAGCAADICPYWIGRCLFKVAGDYGFEPLSFLIFSKLRKLQRIITHLLYIKWLFFACY
jgi:hypothetical protein